MINSVNKRRGLSLTTVMSLVAVTGIWALCVSTLASAEQQANQVQLASPYYKPGAPVQLVSPFEYSLKEYDELAVELAFAVPSGGNIEITLLTDEGGLSLLSSSHIAVVANKQLIVPVKVRAESSKLAFLRAHIRYIAEDGSESSRALSVAFDSRTEKSKVQLKAAIAPAVISMKATETVY